MKTTKQVITVYEYLHNGVYYYSLRRSLVVQRATTYFARNANSASTKAIAGHLGIPVSWLTVIRAKKG